MLVIQTTRRMDFMPKNLISLLPHYTTSEDLMNIKKYFLIFASFTVLIIALLYGLYPKWFSKIFLDMPEIATDFSHILRAVMGLYISFSLFWFLSAFSDKSRDFALLTTIIFAGGLVTGRLISLFIDGIPSPLLVLYFVMELILVPVACWVYMRPE